MQEADAELVVDGEGRAKVLLTLLVHVRGGWLERLDLPGLDEDMSIDPAEGAYLLSPDGGRVLATVSTKGGVLRLRFDKRDAPRRGEHRIVIAYETALMGRASETLGERIRLRYGLPGWEAGLTRAELRFVLPSGSTAVEDSAVAQEVSHTRQHGRDVVRFTRVHLPRSTPWSVAVDVPAAALGRAQHVASQRKELRAVRPVTTGVYLAAGLFLFAWFARALSRRAARSESYRPAPWGRRDVRWGVRVVAIAVAMFSWPFSTAVSLIALTLLALSFVDRYDPGDAPPFGLFAPLGRADLARARRERWLVRLGFAPALDLASGTVLGALACGVALLSRVEGAFAAQGDPWGLGVLCALVPLATSSRLRRPRSVLAQLAVLERTAARLVTVGSALRLVWHVPERGAPREPRLRVLPFARYPGLLRVELAVDTRRYAPPLVLMVVAEAGSAVDGWLQSAGLARARELSAGGRRVLHLLPVDDVAETLERLFTTLSARSQESFVVRERARNAA